MSAKQPALVNLGRAARPPKAPAHKPAPPSRAPRPPALMRGPTPNAALLSPAGVLQLQRAFGNRAVGQFLKGAAQLRAQVAPRESGLPAGLRAGVEALSGVPLDDVRVHYDSPRPAGLNALAYTQGADIHLGPGQEKHLPHEAWHAAQQKQGRVQPNAQAKGLGINDDSALEREADVMGARAESGARPESFSAAGAWGGPGAEADGAESAVQEKSAGRAVVQRKVGFEFETDVKLSEYFKSNSIPYNLMIFQATSGDWKMVNDNKHMELVTEPFEETTGGKDQLRDAVGQMLLFLKDMAAATKNNTFPKIRDSVKSVTGTTHADGVWDIYLDAPTPLDTKNIKARPQASGGVTLENIPSFIESAVRTKLDTLRTSNIYQQHNTYVGQAQQLSQERITTYQESTGEDIADLPYSVIPSLAEAVIPTFAIYLADRAIRDHVAETYAESDPPAHGFRKLRGLLSLVITYLSNADRSGSVEYSKAAFPLMSRTNFKAMYDSMAPEEKAWFTKDKVLAAANMSGKANTPVFKGGFGQGSDIQYGPTRGAWIDSIRQGTNVSGASRPVDLLSKSSGSSVVAGHAGSSSSMGAFDKLDKSLARIRELVVLEIRTLPNPIGVGDWWPVAEKIFDMMKAINNPDPLPSIEELLLDLGEPLFVHEASGVGSSSLGSGVIEEK